MVLQFVGEYVIAFLLKPLIQSDKGFFVLGKHLIRINTQIWDQHTIHHQIYY